MNKKAIRLFIVVLLTLSITLANIAVIKAEAVNKGDPFENAIPITVGKTYQGKLPPLSDPEDSYVLQVEAGEEYTIEWVKSTNGRSHVHLYIYNQDREELYREYGIDGIFDNQATIYWLSGCDQPLYLIMRNKPPNPEEGDVDKQCLYSLTLSSKEQYDANSGKDAGEYLDTALKISPGRYSGHLAWATGGWGVSSGIAHVHGDDQHDFYTLHIEKGQTINIKVTPELKGAVGIVLFTDYGEVRRTYPPNRGAIVKTSWEAPSSQDVYIDVTSKSSSGRHDYRGGPYILEVEVSPPPGTPAPSPPSTTPQNGEVHYFPLAVGNKWVYDYIEEKGSSKERTGTVVIEVVSKENGVYKIVLLHKNLEGHVTPKTTMHLTYNDSGIYREDYLLIPEDWDKAGSHFKVKGTQVFTHAPDVKAKALVALFESDNKTYSVRAPAGDFDDCRRTIIRYAPKGHLGGRWHTHIEYFAPNMGLVKYEYRWITDGKGGVICELEDCILKAPPSTEKREPLEDKTPTPAFEVIFAICGLLAVAYLLRRRE
ncbi:MAG: PGF-CTERM sorting domain-containing protein [Methanophagales archaeon]|nr:PGF-CTERM sorting domain-containing protein [Methanophagales archaeon]